MRGMRSSAHADTHGSAAHMSAGRSSTISEARKMVEARPAFQPPTLASCAPAANSHFPPSTRPALVASDGVIGHGRADLAAPARTMA